MSWRYGSIQGTEHPNQRIKLILQLMSCGILSKINVIKLWNIILLYCSVSPCNYCLLLLQLANFVVSSDSVDRKNCHKFSKSTKTTFYSIFREVLSGRLNECIRLNEEYQRCFHRTKQKLRENPSERQFEFR